MALNSSLQSFRYRALGNDGSKATGVIEGSDEPDAAQRLRAQGLHVLSLRSSRRLRWSKGVSTGDLAAVLRGLSTLVDAGVPLDKALATTATTTAEPLRTALEDVRRRIREGGSLSDAMKHSPAVFPEALAGMLRAGERASQIDVALRQAADQIESESELRSDIRAALAYPTLILLVGLATLAVLGTVVIPKFAELLTAMEAEVPRSTRLVLVMGAALKRWGWVGLAAIIAGVIAWRYADRSQRRRVHRVLLELPIVGALRLKLASARTCQALGSMLSTGMPILQALEAAEQAAGDHEVAGRLRQSRERLRRGEPLGRSLEAEKALAPLAIQLVTMGESTGRLSVLTTKAGEVLVTETRRSIRTLVSLLEPGMILLLGGAVGLMAAALLRAVYSIRPGG